MPDSRYRQIEAREKNTALYLIMRRNLAILVILFAISFSINIYLIGGAVDLNQYSARIIDTIIISPQRSLCSEETLNKKVNIKGRIRYSNGESLKNAQVKLGNEQEYTTTDNNGYFFFKDVTPGKYVLEAVKNNAVKNNKDVVGIAIRITRDSQTREVKTMKIAEDSFVVQVPVTVTGIEVDLSIDGENLNLLSAVATPLATAPAGPGTVPTPVIPPAQAAPTVPVIPPTPVVSPAPIIPPLPGVPAGVGGSSGGGGASASPGSAPGLVAADETVSYDEWSAVSSIDIFAARPGNSRVRLIAGETVILPGAAGSYNFSVKNPDAVAVEYIIKLAETDTNNPKLPLRYRLKSGLSGSDYLCGANWQEAAAISTANMIVAAGENAFFTLEWKWLTISDSMDTEIGTQLLNPVYNLKIIINAWYK